MHKTKKNILDFSSILVGMLLLTNIITLPSSEGFTFHLEFKYSTKEIKIGQNFAK